ncbi:histidine utilization repressor [Rhizobium metallidurans]|uniref:Histidine utilization repressor n=1 Tax=Rhizobium metallidurans TaxID=1265931 RepID=A0A7W6CJZ6_9HYPH|nr:histidine utilization repressor [Rhizobium metallidurans]MBB3962383.1 GntR family histidine utilization transcriptional repressor [Rhizobium metallidurans]
MDQGRDITLHQRIVNDIEGRIVSGEWPPGHRIPFELELTKAYDCSRMTVNKALTQLAKAGLIERRKKSGSFVTQPQAQSAVLEIHDIAAEVKSLNLAYSFSVARRAKRKADADDNRRLELQPGSSVVEVVCIHHAGGRPFCLEERLISLATVPEAEDADFANLPPGAWLINQIPWSSAEHRIQAVAAGGEAATLLDIARNTACLVVERRTWSNVGPVTHVRFTYPGDKHALVARFTPAS